MKISWKIPQLHGVKYMHGSSTIFRIKSLPQAIFFYKFEYPNEHSEKYGQTPAK